jgi:hypothetical protein
MLIAGIWWRGFPTVISNQQSAINNQQSTINNSPLLPARPEPLSA